MRTITFYFDVISPYAYLAFEALPQALSGLSYQVQYKPVVLGAILKHHGQLGPAEIPSKREWTYRQVLWLAQQAGVPLILPAVHPFHSLALQRLAVATDMQGLPNRYVCEMLFRHVWLGGGGGALVDAADSQRLAVLAQQLHSERPLANPADSEAVKTLLRAHTQDAIHAGVFGVPSFAVDGKVFWGLDSLPMLRAYLQR